MKIYSMLDVCTGEYGVPFFAVNTDDCKRRIAYDLRNHPFTRDLRLFEIGEFDVDTGGINTPEHPVFIDVVSDIIGEQSAEKVEVLTGGDEHVEI
nr:MAG: nonstructural protein [Microviridae sp.]